MEFSRQEYWSGLIFPTPANIPDSGAELRSSALQSDSLPSEPPEKPNKFRQLEQKQNGKKEYFKQYYEVD